MPTNRKYIAVWLCTLSFVELHLIAFAICPEGCVCNKVSEGFRVKCGGGYDANFSDWRFLHFEGDEQNIVSLDLSKNFISRISKEHFRYFTKLKRLDLSSNSLQEVDKNTFGDVLPMLERLKLYNNSISHINIGSFDHLQSLKLLDISNNPLVCDCDLIWLVAWSNDNLVKLQPLPKCEAPADFKGTLLKKLKVGQDLHCESPLQPLLKLIPKSDQVVYEGDELMLKCRAPRIAVGVPRESEDLPTRAHIFWGWSEKKYSQNSNDDTVFKDPKKLFDDVHLETKHSTDSGILNSILRIESITQNHTGIWDCTLRSQLANLSQSIVVTVIAKNTEYCPSERVYTNKGEYHWPQTIRGEVVYQKCTEDSDSIATATYNCGMNGSWMGLNTDACPFVSETTRILEQFAKINLTFSKGNALEISRRLQNFTYTHKIRDPIDLEFIARTFSKFLVFTEDQSDISRVIFSIVSKLLSLPHRLFYEAQRLYQTGSKMLNALEVALVNAHTTQLNAQNNEEPELIPTPKNLFIDFFNIKTVLFSGISCIWYRIDDAPTRRNFECNTANDSFPTFDRFVDAAIQIPDNLLLDDSQESITLMVAIFQNANLLPHINIQSNSSEELRLTSAVIGAKLIEAHSHKQLPNTSFKISILLRAHPFHDKYSEPLPAWWDIESNTWYTNACQRKYMHRGLLMFSCDRIGYYGLLQATQFLNDFPNEDAGALFRLAPIGIYVGSIAIIICSWINIVTFIVFGHDIRISRHLRHSLINTWIAISGLCLAFVLGIFQTEHYGICKIFGLLMHYLSLCVMLWICVSLSTMYKHLSKSRVCADADLPKDVHLRKPILGIYLVGWGVGTIICGISSAANLGEYASYSFCFLHNISALNAILVPSVILLVFLAILFLCIYYHINRKVLNVLQSQEFGAAQGIENIDMDWLNSRQNTNQCSRQLKVPINNLEQYSSLTLSNLSSSILDDYERSNMAHLRAHLLFLVLFLVSWLSAAAHIAQYTVKSQSNSHVFSNLFATSSCLLGIFIVIFYTWTRNDIRRVLRQGALHSEAGGSAGKNRHGAKRGANTVMSTPAYKSAYDVNNSASRSNSQCSHNRSSSVRSLQSNSHKNERTARYMDCSTQNLLGTATVTAPVVVNNYHIGGNASNSTVPSEIPNADIFYNPNQINVARKFFKKQKRLAKRNNFELQRQMDRFAYGDNLSDISSLTESGQLYSKRHTAVTMFSSGSKINNTNFNYRTPQFASAGAGCGDDERILMYQANLLQNKKSISSNPLVANIYTNISETTMPKHEVIKVRGNSRGASCKPILVEPLCEHDEMEHENNSQEEENIALYENTTIRKKKKNYLHGASSDQQQQQQQHIPLISARTLSEGVQLKHADMKAMNNLGLPKSTNAVSEENAAELVEQDNVTAALHKDEIYVSNSLQITNRIEVDDDFPAVLVRINQNQSKSLNNISDILNTTHAHICGVSKLNSTSSNGIAQTRSSTVWYKTPSGRMQTTTGGSGKTIESGCMPEKSISYDKIHRDRNGFIDDSIFHHHHHHHHHDHTSRSPTNISDINYQNSEISIRSIRVYAPQADNDLNLTLTDDFPYQSSNASEAEDALNDFDEKFDRFIAPGSNESDLQDPENSDPSIDELYEAIKCRKFTTVQRNLSNSLVSPSDDLPTVVKTDLVEQPQCSPFYSTEVKMQNKETLNETCEDDSSQSSVISYIDPTKNDKTDNI